MRKEYVCKTLGLNKTFSYLSNRMLSFKNGYYSTEDEVEQNAIESCQEFKDGDITLVQPKKVVEPQPSKVEEPVAKAIEEPLTVEAVKKRGRPTMHTGTITSQNVRKEG